ncbi:MAG: 50S ribosomal protein L22 [Candidatus Eremiobacteraeota bacterium]|nr:50S ribosomal protein L22 [Candidatus Eremiobacteraeota bacterium]
MAVHEQARTEAVAHLKFARMGPRKLRRVADAIRGKSVREALVMLQFAGVFAAEPIEKLVKSAVANAGNNHDLNTDDLFITRITVDGGPGGRFTKRLDPRAQGRANFKRKRMSHVTVAVGEKPITKQRKVRGGASISLKRPLRRSTGAATSTDTSQAAPKTRKASTKSAQSARGKAAHKKTADSKPKPADKKEDA